jgi:hypothetical protein
VPDGSAVEVVPRGVSLRRRRYDVPNTTHQNRATRSGSARSKVTWNCLIDVTGAP